MRALVQTFPKQDDYPVFLATSERPGKSNSGEYVVRIGKDNAPELDSHGHMLVEHDLDEIAGDFLKWGKNQGFDFCAEAE
jgi:type I restriction enzyme M protein